MHGNIDLRYTLPPLISLLFMFLLPFDYDPLPTYHPTAKMAFLLLISIIIFLFLSISIKLSLSFTVAANAIRLQAGDFSGPVAISLLLSVLLPRPHFWIAYLIIICISPWYSPLLNLLKRFLCWFYDILQATPTLNIIFFTQQQEYPEQEPPHPPQVEVELAEFEVIVVDE